MTPQAPVTPVVPVPPAVVLISAPSVAAGGSVVLGTATAAGSDSLSVALVSDSLVTTGSSIALRNGQIVYTPGNYGTSQAGTDRIAYSVTDTTNGTVTSETQSLTLQAPAAVTTAPAVVLGSGPQSITLGISEDAYLGNALFTIAVDGVQIGGTQTALAPHGGSSDQAFTVNGSFASGSHTIVVDFLNDAYAGTPQTDRNLYVDTIATGGVSSHVGAALLSQGPQSFNVTLAGTPAVPPTVSLAPAPTAASGGSVVLGTVTASRGDALTIALTSDASRGAGSTIALQNGTIVYTPGSLCRPPGRDGQDRLQHNRHRQPQRRQRDAIGHLDGPGLEQPASGCRDDSVRLRPRHARAADLGRCLAGRCSIHRGGERDPDRGSADRDRPAQHRVHPVVPHPGVLHRAEFSQHHLSQRPPMPEPRQRTATSTSTTPPSMAVRSPVAASPSSATAR